MQRYGILTVGLTHSGKSTFASSLEDALSNLVVLDRDRIASFLNVEFPKIVHSEHNQQEKAKGGGIKAEIFNTLFRSSLQAENTHVMIATGNTQREIRQKFIDQMHDHSLKVIIIFFDYPLNVLLTRINRTKRSTTILASANSFTEVLERQHNMLEIPTEKEADLLFQIRTDEDLAAVTTSLLKHMTQHTDQI